MSRGEPYTVTVKVNIELKLRVDGIITPDNYKELAKSMTDAAKVKIQKAFREMSERYDYAISVESESE